MITIETYGHLLESNRFGDTFGEHTLMTMQLSLDYIKCDHTCDGFQLTNDNMEIVINWKLTNLRIDGKIT